jgi:hypothetical protein
LLAFVEKYPELMYEVNHSIEEFIRSESGRVKSAVPSLGDWLALLSVSNKYNWRHVAKAAIGKRGEERGGERRDAWDMKIDFIKILLIFYKR